MPMSGRSSFPLRSAIPLIVRCATNKPIDLSNSSPLAFRLYRRLRLLTDKKQKPIAMQQEAVAEAALRYSVESRGVHRINGIIALPPNCVPTFDMHGLSLDYYVAVVRVLDGAVLHKEAVNLACPPPVEPKTAYGPYPSGFAWRSAQQAALQQLEAPSPPEESPPLASHMSSPASTSPPPPLSRQRPSVSSVASSSPSSAHATSRRTSTAPSFRSYRSGSTDSTHYASAASSLNHANTGTASASAAASAAAPMGLAGMANSPPASSAGASGFVHAPYSSNLDPVKERSATPSSVRATPIAPSKARATQPDLGVSVIDTSDTASIASSTRRRDRYSSRGAAPVPEASSTRSSVDHHPHQGPTMYIHTHEKAAPLTSTASSAGPESSNARRGLFVTNAEDPPSIPAKASSSAREHANALVGASSSSRKPRDKRAGRERSSKTSTSASRSRTDAATASAQSSSSRNARDAAPRPLPATPAPPLPDSIQNLPPPAALGSPPASPRQTTLLDPSAVLTNEDLMCGEDMQLELPPSYFEAVYGAEEEDDDG